MMKPKLNRRGCLVFTLFILVAIAAILWFAGQAPPAPEPEGIPPRAIESEGSRRS